MVQNYKADCFNSAHIVATDMAAVENNFACLHSMFSGTTSPPNPSSGNMWYCTTKENLRIRNGTNERWIGILTGDHNALILIYRNDTDDGFSIYQTALDCVVGIKSSGSYIVGGSIVGSWSITDANVAVHTHTRGHTHTIDGGAHYHSLYGYGGGEIGALVYPSTKDLITGTDGEHSHAAGSQYDISTFDSAIATATGSSWRPAAIVCTLQILDFSFL